MKAVKVDKSLLKESAAIVKNAGAVKKTSGIDG